MSATLANLAITQLLQVTALLAVAGLLHRLLAGRAPRFMAALWTVVAIKAVTPPVFSASWGLFSWTQAASVAATRPTDGLLTVDWATPLAAAAWWPVVGSIWLIGALATLGMLLVSRLRLARELRRDGLPSDHPLHRYVVGLAERYGLAAPSRVVVSRSGLGPAVAGVTRPTIVLPSGLVDDRDPAVLRPVLLHELVHTTRRDTLLAWLHACVRIVWWFHPLAWWACRRADGLVERCVDLTVTRDLQTSLVDYGRGLLRVLELRRELRPRADLASLRPCQITTERLEFLRSLEAPLRRGRWRERLASFGRFAVAGLVALVLLPALPVDALSVKCQPGPAWALANEGEATHSETEGTSRAVSAATTDAA